MSSKQPLTLEKRNLGISIDPGVSKGCGYGLWKNGILIEAGWIPGPKACFKLPTLRVAEGAIEMPVIRPHGKYKIDLMALMGVVGKIQGANPDVEWTLVKPEEWKKQLPKSISMERILARLSAEERETITDMRHDVFDAIGIGLYVFSRERALV